MRYNEGFNTDKFLEKLDVELRNLKIVTSWEIMSSFTDMKYREKITYLSGKYHLSDKRIENIIQGRGEGEPN